MQTLKQHKEIVIGIIAALVVGLSLGYGIGRQQGYAGADMEMTLEQQATTTRGGETSAGVQAGQLPNNAAAMEGNAVTIADQAAGKSVAVASVTLTQKGWIAIRDSSGRTLGAALFPAGTQTDVSVPLLRATEAGQGYQALVYFDDGTKTFNLKTETIVLNPDGTVAGTTFRAE